MKNILVTGGAGYVGSHACKALAEAGYVPVAFDNLVFGQGFSVCQVIDVARQVTGRPIVALIGEPRTGDPAQLVGDASRIRRELQWQPRHATLEEIVRTAWRWHSEFAAQKVNLS